VTRDSLAFPRVERSDLVFAEGMRAGAIEAVQPARQRALKVVVIAWRLHVHRTKRTSAYFSWPAS